MNCTSDNNSQCPQSALERVSVKPEPADPAFSSRRWLRRTGVALAMAAMPLIVAPAVAEASPLAGCLHGDQVCLYNGGGEFVGAYSDATSYWQPLASNQTASISNLFPVIGNNAHVVYFRHGEDSREMTSCVEPQREASVDLPGYPDVTGIMIRPGLHCYSDGGIG